MRWLRCPLGDYPLEGLGLVLDSLLELGKTLQLWSETPATMAPIGMADPFVMAVAMVMADALGNISARAMAIGTMIDGTSTADGSNAISGRLPPSPLISNGAKGGIQ